VILPGEYGAHIGRDTREIGNGKFVLEGAGQADLEWGGGGEGGREGG